MSDNTLHDDVQVLKEKVALLDGWRMGESERYDRLERDVAGTREEMRGFRTDVNDEFKCLRNDMKDELKSLRDDMNDRFVQMDGRFVQMDGRFAQMDGRFAQMDRRIDDSNRRINQILWLMLITIAGVATNLVVLVLK